MKLIFASQNSSKILEIRAILGEKFDVLPLDFLRLDHELEETGSTLAENALQKARAVHLLSGMNCFADDSGLEVEVLGGAPGVFSARYAGEEKNPDKNMDKLLDQLHNSQNRKARFVTIIALILNGKEYLFEGEIPGEIAREKSGNAGFGYDPVFVPDGFGITFAQMDKSEKNRISHRAIAVNRLAAFLSAFTSNNPPASN